MPSSNASASRTHHTRPKRVSNNTGQAPPCRQTSARDAPRMSDANSTNQAAPEQRCNGEREPCQDIELVAKRREIAPDFCAGRFCHEHQKGDRSACQQRRGKVKAADQANADRASTDVLARPAVIAQRGK